MQNETGWAKLVGRPWDGKLVQHRIDSDVIHIVIGGLNTGALVESGLPTKKVGIAETMAEYWYVGNKVNEGEKGFVRVFEFAHVVGSSDDTLTAD